MPHSAVSDLDLHCLPMSLLLDARLIWVKALWHHKVPLNIQNDGISKSSLESTDLIDFLILSCTKLHLLRFQTHSISKLSFPLKEFAPCITKTCLYNCDPLKPHFYTVKLGFTGVYIIFLISAQKHRFRVHVRTTSLRRF